jgi:hypothetical protein
VYGVPEGAVAAAAAPKIWGNSKFKAGAPPVHRWPAALVRALKLAKRLQALPGLTRLPRAAPAAP